MARGAGEVSGARRRLLGWLFAAAVGAVLLPHVARSFVDPDLWWHLKTGLTILERGAIPSHDPYSFTAPQAPWTDHEWLAEVIYAVLFRCGADRGLVALRLAMLSGGCGLLAFLIWRRLPHPVLAAAILVVAVPQLAGFWDGRPADFTYVGVLAVLVCLEQYAAGRRRAIWIVPVLTALWANLHAGVLLGLGVATVGVGSLLLGAEGGRPAPPERARLGWALAAAYAATLLNPQGVRLFQYLAHELRAQHVGIAEWVSLAHEPAAWWPYGIAAGVPALLVVLARSWRRRPAEIALFALSAVAAFLHVRFVIALVLFGCMVAATAVGALVDRVRRHGDSVVVDALATPRAGALAGAALLLLGLPPFLRDATIGRFHFEVDPRRAPVLAVRFLADYDLGPNLAVRPDWGSYALWHLAPRYKVASDGRYVTVYSETFLNDFLGAWFGGGLLPFLAPYHPDAFLVEARGAAYDELAAAAGWRLAFRDGYAAVFVPRTTFAELAQRRRATRQYTLEVPVVFP